MSETPLSPFGSSDAEIADQSVQRQWDRYAMPDLSGDQQSQQTPLALTVRSTTNATLVVQLYESSPAFGSTTSMGDAFAKAQSSDLTEDDHKLPLDRGATDDRTQPLCAHPGQVAPSDCHLGFVPPSGVAGISTATSPYVTSAAIPIPKTPPLASFVVQQFSCETRKGHTTKSDMAEAN